MDERRHEAWTIQQTPAVDATANLSGLHCFFQVKVCGKIGPVGYGPPGIAAAYVILFTFTRGRLQLDCLQGTRTIVMPSESLQLSL